MTGNDLNPFPVSGYHGAEYFCNREKETRGLVENALNGVKTILLSVRRMGKSGLLHHTIGRVRSKGTGIYADIFDTNDFRGFTGRIATAALRAFPEKHPFWKKTMLFLRQLRPVISYDEMTGQPQVTFDYGSMGQYEHSLSDIWSFLERQQKPVLVAVDEFQQISRYPGKNTEAILRTQIQNLRNVRFIFSGSSHHILAGMFHHAGRPFFSSAQTMELGEIPFDDYRAFIEKKFRERGRSIEPEAVGYILDFTRRHTYYTQALCNKVFAAGTIRIKREDARFAAHELLLQNEPVFFQYRGLLSRNQWSMLRAIAKEGRLTQPNAKQFVERYGLGPSSAVKRSLEALMTKEMIFRKETEEERYYTVYDCFLARWLERH